MIIVGNTNTHIIKVNSESILQFVNHQGTVSLFVYESGLRVVEIAPIATYEKERTEEINKWIVEKLNSDEQVIHFPA